MQLTIADSVREAQSAGTPVVALETTVITHGLDWPDNLDTALAMQSAVREAGACPATLGVVRGRVTVGLDDDELERFARAERGTIDKCSRRDLPVILSKARDGSLTVAGTLLVARAAGIDLMATGGIGGVHRDAPFDVSADLNELGRTPVACVCAGAKSLLDLAATLEVLETHGVPVVGLGTATLPAFFTRDSGLPLPAHVADVAAAARVLAAWRDSRVSNGLVLAVPVPAAHALPRAEADAAIDRALGVARRNGIVGSAVTPYVLARIARETGGRSVAANKALLVHNARTAGELAVAARQTNEG